MCHCLACQRRTGSAFAIQARFPEEQVRIEGWHTDYVRVSDQEDRSEHVFSFCPDCGATVFYRTEAGSDQVAVPIGAFAEPSFPAPTVSVWESRRHPWVVVPESVDRHID